jgi:hypothetical protein
MILGHFGALHTQRLTRIGSIVSAISLLCRRRHLSAAYISTYAPEHCAGEMAPVAFVVLPRGQLTHALAAAAFLARYLGWYLPCNMAAAHHVVSCKDLI